MVHCGWPDPACRQDDKLGSPLKGRVNHVVTGTDVRDHHLWFDEIHISVSSY